MMMIIIVVVVVVVIVVVLIFPTGYKVYSVRKFRAGSLALSYLTDVYIFRKFKFPPVFYFLVFPAGILQKPYYDKTMPQ